MGPNPEPLVYSGDNAHFTDLYNIALLANNIRLEMTRLYTPFEHAPKPNCNRLSRTTAVEFVMIWLGFLSLRVFLQRAP
jgi:hypothetical protein